MANHHLMIYITINIITIYYHIIIIYYKQILPLLLLYDLFFSVVIILPLRLPFFTLFLPRKSWGSPRERRKYFGVHLQQLRSLRETVPWMPWKWETVGWSHPKGLGISPTKHFQKHGIYMYFMIHIYIFIQHIFLKQQNWDSTWFLVYFCGGVILIAVSIWGP